MTNKEYKQYKISLVVSIISLLVTAILITLG